MLIFREFFKTQSDQNYTPKRTKLHLFSKISRVAYAFELLKHICVQLYYNYFYMKITILLSKLFQNIHQNENVLYKIRPKYTPKRTRLHYFKNFLEGKFSNLEKKLLAPLPNPGYAPA